MLLPSDVRSMVSRLLADLGTARSLTVAMMVRSKEWKQLAELKCDPADYLDTVSHGEKFSRDLQATDLLRKCADLDTPVDRRQVAREGWLSDERSNAATNARLEPWLTGYPAELDPGRAARIWNVIQTARKDIKRVLGRIPASLPDFRFGPGTAIGFSKDRLPWLPNKLSTTITITAEAKPIFEHGFPHAWERSLYSARCQPFCITESERFSTVPKTALTDRTIGIQPLGNLSVQAAIGRVIRRRLLYSVACIDLVHGQALHARKAREASISNEDATIDLQSASNSVTRRLCQLLLPSDWFELLDATRVRFSDHGRALTKGKTERYRLEMFSAMGNGFTFELETLLFWSICRGVGVEKPLVYGDDIIVPSNQASDVTAALAYFGFRTNSKKTFKTGPFRESCGGVYFLGREILTYRMENFPNGPLEWINVNNGLWRTSRSFGCDVTKRARLVAIHSLPSPIRRFGGPTHLDGVLHGVPASVAKTEHGIVWARRLVQTVPTYPFKRFGGSELHLAMALYGVDSNGYAPRASRETGYTIGLTSVS